MVDPDNIGTGQPVRLRHDFIQDPHPLYRDLRSKGPVHPVILGKGVRAWLVTGYDDARTLLNDHRLSKDNARARELFPPGTAGGNDSLLSANMLHTDPPDHTRLRALVAKAFTARAVARLQPRIEHVVGDLLDRLPTESTVDLVQSFALPLPISMICSLLGVPSADHDKFADWTRPFVTESGPDDIREAEAATTEYLTGLIAAKREAPNEDVLSALAQVSDRGDRLSADELLAMAFLLILAGFETTVSLISNGVLTLLRNPSQLALLRTNPDLIPRAVEEFLRIESPINTATNRFTVEPVRVGDTEIPPGEFVVIALLSANHDAHHFSDPDQLDITRHSNPHLAFGHGIHHCLGAPLARLEGKLAFQGLLSRFQSISLADDQEITYTNSILVRRINSLPIRVRR
jgi:cytochrome P450